MRLLILGGTTEASACVERLGGDPERDVILSLAGRTRNLVSLAGVRHRVGGFGGADGLARYLVAERIDAVIDATHPFAAQISSNAHEATRGCAIPVCTIVRPAWQPVPEDRWLVVPTMEAAAHALGANPRRVFLAVGRQNVGVFRKAPHHAYVVRSIERPDADALPPDTTLLEARGPFALEDEIELLTSRRIEAVVSKNAGGDATYAKIEAARTLELPVIMIARPEKAGRHIVSSVEEAIAWLDCQRGHGSGRSERGV
jgi:precorrin-6A/cobalt-precorrin-6A reductase